MTTTNRPLRVFLCHSSNDKPIVREKYQKLRATKSTFAAVKSIEVGGEKTAIADV